MVEVIHHDRIKLWLDSLVKFFSVDPWKNFWPLRPPQITSYFDQALAIDIFQKYLELKYRNADLQIVGHMFNNPMVIRNFLIYILAPGLKKANKNGTYKTDVYQRIGFFNYFFDVLYHCLRNDDIFNFQLEPIWPPQSLEGLPWGKAVTLRDSDKTKLKQFTRALQELVRSIYYDAFMSAGYLCHGPYKPLFCPFKFHPEIIVTEFSNLSLPSVWPALPKLPLGQIRIIDVYHRTKLRLDIFDKVTMKKNQSDHHKLSLIYVDDQLLKDWSMLEQWTTLVKKISNDQVGRVDKLTQTEQIKKGAEIAWSVLDKLYMHFYRDSRTPKKVLRDIEEAGAGLAKQYANWPPPKPAEIKKIFDPRNNEV